MKNNLAVQYRPAKVADIPEMLKVINAHANHGHMLHKKYAELLEILPNFFVAELDEKIIGTCAFKIWLTKEIELISSAIIEVYHNRGIGLALNNEVIRRARIIGFTNFFVLTKRDTFYEKLGFYKVPKQNLSHKLYVDCLRCSENTEGDPAFFLTDKCKDVAMYKIVP